MVELTPTADTRAMLAILKAMLARMDTEERERIWGAALIHAQDAATSEAGRAAVRAAIDRVFEG